MVLIIVLACCVIWLALGMLAFIIYQKFGKEDARDDFAWIFFGGALSFVAYTGLVVYERIEEIATKIQKE